MGGIKVEIEIDKDVYEVVATLAEHWDMSVSDALKKMAVDGLSERIRSRLNHPGIGMFDSGQTDVSERDEEIMYGRKDD